MRISIVVHSRGDLKNLNHMIECYNAQTYEDRELIFVIDEPFTKDDFHHRKQQLIPAQNLHIFSEIDAPFIHKNVGFLRNFGIGKATGGFINLMDDDEDFPPNYLEQSLHYRNYYKKLKGKDVILTPTLMYRHSGKIQNQGFSSFNYWLSRPTPCSMGKRAYAEIEMYSGNSLFAPAHIFKQNPMDERFDFVYEDLDYSYGLYKVGYPIIVLRDLKIYHMERDKNKLEEAWIGNVYQAHRKSKHRILFIKKHAHRYQKLQFYMLGFRGQPLRLVAKIFLLAKKKDILPLLRAIRQGTREGIRE